ncbi:PKD domain-containing protein [Dyadobacter psychrophilus]|uniref:PKD repeat-containing protein n=1 Tax=Dyadobacter psychrophilus TaxID=651661 RepID=A0A1T5BK21_9BACT|nr:PKD domain-containing protein [Dyadobacter psychrophilus]SKB47369.1 PKD repeat-containing protein [Dyadobacter psychrophilus]
MRRILIQLLLLAIVFGCHKELPPQPVAIFSFVPETCIAPCKVTFTSRSENANSLEWDFDDGKGIKTGSGPIEYNFEDGKDYYVKLIAKSADGGSHGITQKVVVDAKPASKPEAIFSVVLDHDSIAPATATFSNLSKNAKTYLWNFDDEENSTPSNPDTSKEQNPKHRYEKPGKYSVSLTSYNEENVASEPKVIVVEVKSVKPIANFTFPESECFAPCEIAFTNKSTGAKTYSWDFGDEGAKSAEISPKHIFKEAKSYIVTLTAFGDGGQSNVKTDTVIVKKSESNAVSISSEWNEPRDIIADAVGNIYVCGITRGDTRFGDGRVFSSSSKGKNDFYIAKYNISGEMIWAYVDGSVEDDAANGMALDDQGNVYLTGFVGGAVQINNVKPQGNSDGFVAKFNSAGMRQWFTLYGGPDKDDGAALAFYNTPEGPRVYLAGNITGDPRRNNINFFNGEPAASAFNEDIVFVFLDANSGMIRQPTILTHVGNQRVNALKVDGDGNAYLAGTFEDVIIFPGSDPPLESLGQTDAFVAKWILHPGRFDWSRRAGSPNEDSGYDVVIDNGRNVYVTGKYIGPLTPLGVGSRGDVNVFLGRWNADGSTNDKIPWGRSGFNNGNNDHPGGIAISPGGNILISGSYPGTGSFPFDTRVSYESQGSTDMIIAEVGLGDGLATNKFQITGGGRGEDQGIKICVSPDGHVYSTGFFSGTATFNGKELSTTGSRNTYIVKYKY